jgi:hypothetical protein
MVNSTSLTVGDRALIKVLGWWQVIHVVKEYSINVFYIEYENFSRIHM